jgi:biopolymer transport protein ExbD
MSLRRRSRPEGAALDLTPCSDIIFSLLLFFILTQNFLVQSPLALPRLGAVEQQTKAFSERIEVTASGTLLWNEIPVTNTPGALSGKIATVASGAGVLLLVHRQAPAGVPIELLDRLRRAGIVQVSFGGLPEGAQEASEK